MARRRRRVGSPRESIGEWKKLENRGKGLQRGERREMGAERWMDEMKGEGR